MQNIILNNRVNLCKLLKKIQIYHIARNANSKKMFSHILYTKMLLHSGKYIGILLENR